MKKKSIQFYRLNVNIFNIVFEINVSIRYNSFFFSVVHAIVG